MSTLNSDSQKSEKIMVGMPLYNEEEGHSTTKKEERKEGMNNREGGHSLPL